MKRYYFDYAAATPLDREVESQMRKVYKLVGNPSSLHAEGRALKTLLETARAQIGKVLNTRADTIVFTATATEADNLAIFGAVTAAGQVDGEIITCATEHASVRQCIEVIGASGYQIKDAPFSESGRVRVSELTKLINDKTVLVSIALATSEIGTLQPIAEIGKVIQAVRADRHKRGISTPISLHTDAASAAGLVSLAVDKLRVDLLTISSPKIYGPHGAAALYVRAGTPLTPHTIGGGQERSLRSGTENVPAIVGFAAALIKAEAIRKTENIRLQDLRLALWSELQLIPGIILNSDFKHSLPNTLNISIVSEDGEDLVLRLDALGFALATGAACAESARQPSRVIQAIGRTKEQAQASLRITLGRSSTSVGVKKLAQAIRKLTAV